MILNNDSVFLRGAVSTQQSRPHVCYLSVCLSGHLSDPLPVFLSDCPPFLKCDPDTKLVASVETSSQSLKQTLLLRPDFIQQYQISDRKNGNEIQFSLTSFITFHVEERSPI